MTTTQKGGGKTSVRRTQIDNLAEQFGSIKGIGEGVSKSRKLTTTTVSTKTEEINKSIEELKNLNEFAFSIIQGDVKVDKKDINAHINTVNKRFLNNTRFLRNKNNLERGLLNLNNKSNHTDKPEELVHIANKKVEYLEQFNRLDKEYTKAQVNNNSLADIIKMRTDIAKMYQSMTKLGV